MTLTIVFLPVILLLALDNNMTDNFTFGSDPRFVREQLKAVLILIVETIEGSVPMVLDSMRQQGLGFSPFLFSTNIRCHIKRTLQSGGFNPQETAELSPVALNWISNDGVEFDLEALRMKVLKGKSLPKATSWNRGVFYSQQGSFDFWDGDLSESLLRSLVVLWDYDVALSQLSFLLVAPKSSDGEMLWQLPIPMPAEWLVSRDTLNTDDEDLPIDEAEEEEGEQGE
jgi:hypothetical protein